MPRVSTAEFVRYGFHPVCALFACCAVPACIVLFVVSLHEFGLFVWSWRPVAHFGMMTILSSPLLGLGGAGSCLDICLPIMYARRDAEAAFSSGSISSVECISRLPFQPRLGSGKFCS